ncbi:MAG: hypothetical protein ACK4OE_02365 [Acidovorax sp.]|uniref:hypothetical protein n=1 Tax=Acidovorax sp. TaxID=1872122 RepID=UPI00391DB8CD
MPTLDWLHRAAAFSPADQVPYWLLQTVSHYGSTGSASRKTRAEEAFNLMSELVDGRVALLEYKGAHLLSDPYEIEKSQVGALWAQASGGRAVFGWLTKQQDGQGLPQQINAVLA